MHSHFLTGRLHVVSFAMSLVLCLGWLDDFSKADERVDRLLALNLQQNAVQPTIPFDAALFFVAMRNLEASDETFEAFARKWRLRPESLKVANSLRLKMAKTMVKGRPEYISVTVSIPSVSLSSQQTSIQTESQAFFASLSDVDKAQDQTELRGVMQAVGSKSSAKERGVIFGSRVITTQVFVSKEETDALTAEDLLSKVRDKHPLAAHIIVLIRESADQVYLVEGKFVFRAGEWTRYEGK